MEPQPTSEMIKHGISYSRNGWVAPEKTEGSSDE